MRPPDGIQEEHGKPPTGLRKHASPATILFLGAFLAAALLGAFGKSSSFRDSSENAVLFVEAPSRIRNGEIFEMRVHFQSKLAVDTLVVRIGTDLWKDMTVNTLIPGANEEATKQGEFEFTYGSLPAGEDWLLKASCQINPNLYGLNSGRITVLDGKNELAATDVHIRVLP